ncbi:hypothetical protein [Sinobaca sp. H24]|uniref:hypothetical protein n=1 Tax=Sinobaca sp. H24 TaxID=2923376 RepID=UPI002079B31C|nr:hypothetical protein [Sinobaca sp. H24]
MERKAGRRIKRGSLHCLDGGTENFSEKKFLSFLAVLSAEGIVPKLLWTKRLENGDVITAQKWVNSRELRAKDMGERQVAELLSKSILRRAAGYVSAYR